jgi:hypothetical protein
MQSPIEGTEPPYAVNVEESDITNFAFGLVVPIPTFPDESIRIRSVILEVFEKIKLSPVATTKASPELSFNCNREVASPDSSLAIVLLVAL